MCPQHRVHSNITLQWALNPWLINSFRHSNEKVRRYLWPLTAQVEDVSFLGLSLCSVTLLLCCHPTRSPTLPRGQLSTADTSLCGNLPPHLASLSFSLHTSCQCSQLPRHWLCHLSGNLEFSSESLGVATLYHTCSPKELRKSPAHQ